LLHQLFHSFGVVFSSANSIARQRCVCASICVLTVIAQIIVILTIRLSWRHISFPR